MIHSIKTGRKWLIWLWVRRNALSCRAYRSQIKLPCFTPILLRQRSIEIKLRKSKWPAQLTSANQPVTHGRHSFQSHLDYNSKNLSTFSTSWRVSLTCSAPSRLTVRSSCWCPPSSSCWSVSSRSSSASSKDGRKTKRWTQRQLSHWLNLAAQVGKAAVMPSVESLLNSRRLPMWRLAISSRSKMARWCQLTVFFYVSLITNPNVLLRQLVSMVSETWSQNLQMKYSASSWIASLVSRLTNLALNCRSRVSRPKRNFITLRADWRRVFPPKTNSRWLSIWINSCIAVPVLKILTMS